MKPILRKIIEINKTFLFKSFVILFALNIHPVSGYSAGEKTEGPTTEDPSFELSIENLKQALEDEGVQHADIVLRQAILETGWFKCTSCSLSRNNIFGFWYKKKYIEFEDWKECVAYYKRWQDRHYKGGDYYAFLKKVGFATDPQYLQRLKSIKGL